MKSRKDELLMLVLQTKDTLLINGGGAGELKKPKRGFRLFFLIL